MKHFAAAQTVLLTLDLLDSDQDKSMLKGNASALVHKAKFIEDKLNTAPGFKAFMVNSAEARLVRKYYTDRMRRYIADDKVYQQLLPDFAVGCRRLTPGNPYMRAVQKENVKIHRCAVAKVTPDSIIGSNGDEVKVDTIICATGFDTSFIPRHPIVGRNGISIQDKWSSVPEGYMSVAVPDMPNYFTVMGPSFPIANGSVMGALQAAAKYILQMVQKIQREHIHSLWPKQSVTDAFNEHTQAWMAGAAWQDSKCRSWYKDNRTGRVNAIWPGSSLHFCETMKYPRFEDYEIRYESSANMWEFMGLGFTKNMLSDDPDLSPYISTEEVDDKFIRFEPDLAAEDASLQKMAQMVHDMPTSL